MIFIYLAFNKNALFVPCINVYVLKIWIISLACYNRKWSLNPLLRTWFVTFFTVKNNKIKPPDWSRALYYVINKASWLVESSLLCSKYWKRRRSQFNIELTHYTFWFINFIYLISDISKLKLRACRSSHQIAKIRQHESLSVYGTGLSFIDCVSNYK